MSEIFSQLFESKVRARLIKFFLLNDLSEYAASEIVQKNKFSAKQVSRELNRLERIKLVEAKSRKGVKYYCTNRDFVFYPELKNLVVKSNTLPECRSLNKVKNLGKVKLALISGVFLNYPKSRADLMVVGDELSRAKLKHLLESLEAEIGKEINYSIMSSAEFKYRLDMLDKFIMEFMEAPHEELVNKIPNLKQIITARKK